MPATATFTIITMSRGSLMVQTTINKTEIEAAEAFMERFGEEPRTTEVLYTNGVFDPADIIGQGSCKFCR